jgi:hypothetical protein
MFYMMRYIYNIYKASVSPGQVQQTILDAFPGHFIPRGKRPKHPLYTRLVEPQNRSGRCGVQKSFFPLLEI